jgi:hypothetical protein
MKALTSFFEPIVCRLLILAGMFLIAPSAIHAGDSKTPPDGVYNCCKISGSSLINLGTIEIKNGTYRGLVAEGEFHKFTVDATGNITWSAGLAGFPDGWKVTGSKYLGPDKSTKKPLMKVYYTSARGTADEIDAMQE